MDMNHEIRFTSRDNIRKKSRAWMGTIWNSNTKDLIKALPTKYCLISDDDHTEAGELHWHCLITYDNPHFFPRLPEVHWEHCVSRIGARDYCLNKGPNFYEEGIITLATQKECDWEGFISFCKSHGPKDLIDSPFSKLYAQYRGFAGEVHNQFADLKILNGELQNEWYYGPAGTGKTRKAWEENPDLYIKPINKWWDGYNGEKVVLLDDWDPKHEVLVSHLKQWSDRYPFRAECKGSTLEARPEKIIVTSNYSIDQCFQNPEDIDAIKRRFKVIRFDTLGTHPRH